MVTALAVHSAFAQQTATLDYCNCRDKVDQAAPALNGVFERTCNSVLIEKGAFANGVKHREWVTYSKKGTLIRKMAYDNGVLHGKVALYYAGGQPKMTGEFEKGNKVGRWIYYTEKGRVLAEGSYEVNKPVGTWTINDKKGKTAVVQYDFAAGKYLVNAPAQFHKDGDIMQNENTGEWYILKYPRRAANAATAPLGGHLFAGDLFVELVEVPLDYWDTYIDYKYKAAFKVAPDNSSTFSLTTLAKHLPDEAPIYPFLIITNPDKKIKRVEHSALSVKLLEFKIREALNFMPPWIHNGSSDVEVYIPYVVNKIIRQ